MRAASAENIGSGWFRSAGLLIAGALLLATSALLADPAKIQFASDRLEQIRAQLDRVEAAVSRAQGEPHALQQVRGEAEPLRVDLRELISELEPIHTQTEARLKQLGTPPSNDQPPEALAVASEREQLSALLRGADTALRQARLLSVRSAQLIDGIDFQRRAAFTDRLLERRESFFAPAIWRQAVDGIDREARSIAALFTAWRTHLTERTSAANLLLGLSLSLAAIFAIVAARFWILRRISAPARTASGDAPLVPRSHKAVIAVRDSLLNALAASAAGILVLQICMAFDLVPDSLQPLAISLVSAIVIFSSSYALSLAVLAPSQPRNRLPAIDDEAARTLHALVFKAAAITVLALFANALHRTLTTSVPLTVATSAVYAFLIASIIALALYRSRPAAEREDGGVPPWIRLLGWIAASVILAALAAGYIRFAALVAERVVLAAVALIALTLLLALVDAFFGEGLDRDSPRRSALAATLGLRTRTLGLSAALLAGLLRTLLVLAAIFLVVGTLTTSAIDIASTLDRTSLTIEIGQMQIRLGDVIGAAIMLLIGIIATRIVYRWLAQQVLPRTDLETSLQNSIATIAGYIGVIVAIALALARLGVNLENIALVAGALSIGIGFGLQSVVSNFVSGLILLTERPIRVGDWIVVGNEQGYVRKISVRSTEIETFDRASVIVPNSDLITGTVKNWTHFNKQGRFSIPIGISYDSDPEAVRELLLEIAKNHPSVLETPPPAVFFLSFGDSSLQIDLRGFVADVNTGFGVASDLRFEIFRRFREAGIEIPFPQRDIHIKSAPGTMADEEETEETPPKSRKR